MSELNLALADAHRWLDDHAEATEGAPLYYGINNLRRFLSEVEADHSAFGIERACHALGYHIVDQKTLTTSNQPFPLSTTGSGVLENK